MIEFTASELLYNKELHESFSDSIKKDLDKCRKQPKYQTPWVFAEQHNKKPMVIKKTKIKQWPEWIGL